MVWTHERTVIVKTEVQQLGINYLQYTPRFRELRGSITKCELCLTPFKDMQRMHIAIAKPGNKLICDSCADEAIKHGVPVPMKREVSE